MVVTMFMLRFALISALLASPVFAGEREDLFDALGQAKTEVVGRAAEDAIWKFWMIGPNEEATALVARAMERRRWYDFAGALEILNEAVEKAPEWAEAWNQRAFIHFLRENYDKSLDDLERALELEPKHFGALAGKARILMRQGRMELGQKFLRQAAEIHPFLKERSMLIKLPEEEL